MSRDYTQIDLRHTMATSADQESQAIEDDDYAARWDTAYNVKYRELLDDGVPDGFAKQLATNYADANA